MPNPNPQDIAAFLAGESKWNDSAPSKQLGGIGGSGHSWGGHDAAEWKRQNELADALNSTWYIEGTPESAADYESRVANMIAVAESRGWTAQRIKREEHRNEVSGFTVPYSEQFIVEDTNVNLYAETIRVGMDFTGLIQCESWFRAQYAEEAKEIKARQLKEAKALRDHNQRQEEALSQPVYGWQLEEISGRLDGLEKLLRDFLESKLAGDA